MNLNKKTEYSLAVLSFMAISQQEIFSAEHLHDELKIPRSYLRRLLTELSRFGFLQSAKGRKGGFIFAKPLAEIHLSQVINSIEGSEALGNCIIGHLKCNNDKPCIMHDTWMEAKIKMLNTLDATTLQDLKQKKEKLRETEEPNQ